MAPRVEIFFGANVRPFMEGVDKIKSKLINLVPSELKLKLGQFASGLFGTAALKGMLSAADDLQTFANRLRVSVRTIQEWKYAADETDTSLQAFATSFRHPCARNGLRR